MMHLIINIAHIGMSLSALIIKHGKCCIFQSLRPLSQSAEQHTAINILKPIPDVLQLFRETGDIRF